MDKQESKRALDQVSSDVDDQIESITSSKHLKNATNPNSNIKT